jgi:diguanylate cyclase
MASLGNSIEASHNPTQLARLSLKRLAQDKVAPTPENYRKVYHLIAGQASGLTAANDDPLRDLLAGLLRERARGRPRYLRAAESIAQFESGNETDLRTRLLALLGEESPAGNWRGVILDLVRLSSGSPGLTREQRRDLEAAATRYAEEPEELRIKLSGLLAVWREAGPTDANLLPSARTNVVPILPGMQQDAVTLAALMQRTVCLLLDQALLPVVCDRPQRHEQVRHMSELAGRARLAEDWREILQGLNGLASDIEHDARDARHTRDRLVALIRLVIANLGDLVDEPAWFRGQTVMLSELLSAPMDSGALDDAERVVSRLVAQQAQLRRALDEARQAFQDMILKFISMLGDTAGEVNGYGDRLGGYSSRIQAAGSIADLGKLVRGLLDETDGMRSKVQHAAVALEEARDEARRAQEEVDRLTTEMDTLSTSALHDYLTGSLNRRGLDAVLDNELRRARRNNSPLAVALIDLDHFKRLNDRHGHAAGDMALRYLVSMAGRTLRETDRVARYGGEEFAIVMPDTGIDEAEAVMIRLQRELTRELFLHDDQRLLITFSAGVTVWNGEENPDIMMKRADAAMYRAKEKGRNLVFRG